MTYGGPIFCRGSFLIFMRRLELYQQTLTRQDATSFCKNRELLARQVRCQICGSEMKAVGDNRDDSIIWTCRNVTATESHRTKTSIRHHSFFSGSKLSLKKQVYMIYEWAAKTGISVAAYQLDVSEKATIKMFARLLEMAGYASWTALPPMIGGQGAVVEIDECQVGRRKHHRGRVPQELWIFGAVERGSNPLRGFIEVVANRNRQTLEEVIIRRINPQ